MISRTHRQLLCAVFIASFVRAAGALTPTELRTEWLSNPIGVETPKPRLSWRVESELRGDRQTAYHLLVASSAGALDRNEGDMWDSGKVTRSETLGIVYEGKPLASNQRAFWKLKVWDKDGRESPWSEPARWSAGLKPEDWKAEWISFKDDQPVHADRTQLFLPPAHHFRKQFEAKSTIKRATLYGSALGLVEFHLNGERVSETYFEPGWSDYRQRVYYRAHDVTSRVTKGANQLGAIVADGWYAGYVGYGLLVGYGPNKSGRNFYGKTPALLAQLEIEYEDGSSEIVRTDTSWRVSADGPFREADLIMGESFDARLDQRDWCRVGMERGWKWEPAIRAEENGGVKAIYHDTLGQREVQLGFQRPKQMQAYPAQPISVTKELTARQITEPAPGVFIFDFGQNFAGNIRLRLKGEAGTKVRIRYGEMLHPNGTLMTENLRKARATDFYTFRGDPEAETWTPRFTYHGFQFAELTGPPKKPPLNALTGLVIHNQTPLVSRFECSDDMINRLFQNIVWTQRANFVEIPTDCPQRDERLGWMGDAQIYARAATFNADVAAFFTKWLDDVEEAQRDFGAYPDYAPYPMAHGEPGKAFGTAWTDAGIICPWTMWRVYGDTRIIARHWASMQRFMEWRRKSAPDLRGVSIGNTWGDWLNVGEKTPIEFIDICYHALDARLMSEMAEAIGRRREAEAYAKLFTDIRAVFQTEYVKPDETLAVDTQTAHVLALAFALVPDNISAKTAARLAEKIEGNGGRMATGFLGTKALLPTLSAMGHHDLAVRLFQSREFPSWGYPVINGATSIWERWDSFTKEEGFGRHNAAMNSFSHYAFGAVCEWMFRFLVGIDTEDGGYSKILLRPGPPTPGSNPKQAPIDSLKADYVSPRGRIAVAWKREPERFSYDVTIPANTAATLFLPATSPEKVTVDGRPLREAKGTKFQRLEWDSVVCSVESGTYRFVSELKR